MIEDNQDKLFVLWTSADPGVAHNMVFMYTKNSVLRGWWGTVRLIVWGPSAKLLAENEALQAELAELRHVGVELQACKACSDRYGVSEKLSSLGVEVIPMGEPMTELIKSGWRSLCV